MESSAEDFLSPFGISADTGLPISGLSDEAVTAMLGKGPEPALPALNQKTDTAAFSFAVIGDVDANDLSQSGWGVKIGRASCRERV